MNTYKVKYIFLYGLLSLLCFSCSDDIGLFSNSNEDGLWINLKIEGQTKTRATVDGDAALNENKLQHIDVFVGKDGDLSTYHKRFSDTLTTTTGRLQLADKTWKTTFPNTGYDVYLVANATENLNSVTTLSALKEKTQTDNTIYKPYSSTDNSSKLFLMDGVYKDWTPSSADTITVELNRAAAKIVANISLSTDMANSYTMGTVQWSLRNYATTAAIIAEGQGTLSAGTETMGSTSINATSDTIITYSDPCKWTGVNDIPYLLVNVPLTKKSDNTVKDQNWYRIPVRDASSTATDGKQLDRNHIYYVNATIASEGSSTDVIEDQQVDLKYAVADWITEGIDLYDLNEEHLYVTPTLVYMRNLADSVINYYASSQVEVVKQGVYYYDEDGNKKDYTDANLVTLTPVNESDESFNGVVKISSPIPDEEHAGAGTPSALTAGKFTIRFIRFRVQLVSNPAKYQDILIKQYPLEYIQNIKGWYSTRNADGWIDWARDSKEYKKRDEPMTYGGYYNVGQFNTDYADGVMVKNPKNGVAEAWDTANPITKLFYFNFDIYKTGTSTVSATGHSQIFLSRVYEDGIIYNYADVRQEDYLDETKYETAGYFKAEKIPSYIYPGDNGVRKNEDNNNAMYVVQLTRTSKKYTVARPTMNTDNLTDDDVASPAFMCASQLGVTYMSNDAISKKENASTYQKFAAAHCKTYREVGTDGTIWDDWRLPTKDEIGVIIEYQPTQAGVSKGAPIKGVLKGPYYFTSNTDAPYAATGYTNSNYDYIYIRCVRDLTPAEVKKLDEDKK